MAGYNKCLLELLVEVLGCIYILHVAWCIRNKCLLELLLVEVLVCHERCDVKLHPRTLWGLRAPVLARALEEVVDDAEVVHLCV